jgi:hypothetical protein
LLPIAFRWAGLAGVLLCLLVPAGAGAQTRLTLFGGGLVPFGDLEKVTDPSLEVGARAEYQPVNALGKRRLNSWFLQACWTPLETKPELEAALASGGESADADLVVVSVGARIYSRAAPFFLQVGGGWGLYDAPGATSSEDVADFHVGAGFLLPIPLLYLEADASLHQAFGSNDLSLTYLSANAGVSLPF